MVPETLLKKRKSQEKARAEKSAEIEKKKKVCSHSPFTHFLEERRHDVQKNHCD